MGEEDIWRGTAAAQIAALQEAVRDVRQTMAKMEERERARNHRDLMAVIGLVMFLTQPIWGNVVTAISAGAK